MPYSWEWIDPDGTATGLTVEYDVDGLFAPPVEISSRVVPGQPGAVVYQTRHGVREFSLALYERNDDPALLHARLRALVYAMDPTRGAGRLRATTPAGDQREITCRVLSGMGLSQVRGAQSLSTHQRAEVTFQAADPYWYDTSDTVTDYTIGATAPFFPIFPLRLSSSEVFVDGTVDNLGDLETWPVWTLTGPGSSISVRNLTTGALTTINGLTLAAGETVTIDTRPTIKTVTRGDGANLFGSLATGSSLWPLIRGGNSVRVEMTGGTESSLVRLSRKHRYFTP